jgi:PKD repeat protein
MGSMRIIKINNCQQALRMLVLSVLGLFSFISAYAQLTFYKTIGGPNTEVATDFEVHPNGGYIVCGQTLSYTSGASDMFLARLNAIGDTVWVRSYGGASSEFAYGVEILPNGQYWVVGKTASYSFGNFDYMIMRTDSLGNVLYWNEFGGTGAEEGNSFLLHPVSGYFVGGWASSLGAGGSDFYVARFDGNNQLLWTRTFGGLAGETMNDMQLDTDGGLLLSGTTFTIGQGSADAFVIKTDSSGQMLWNRAYGAAGTDEIRSIMRLPGGGLLFAGQTKPPGTTAQDMMLVRTDSLGDTLWVKSYGGANNDYVEHVSATSDGGFLLVGGAGTVFSNDALLVRVNANGDTLWTRRYGSTGQDYLYKMKETPTGDFFGVGAASTGGAGTEDALFLRVDSAGNAGCRRVNYVVQVKRPTLVYTTGATVGGGYLNQSLAPTQRNAPMASIKACETCEEPVANFSYSANNLQVDFIDSSLTTTSRFWDFGDGQNSTATNPSHTYASPGSYTVCLISSNTCERDTLCMNLTLTCPLPIANFGHQEANLSVQLSDSSINAIAWTWDYGDGNGASVQNPNYTYASPGSYNVCLTAQNSCGVHVDCESLLLNCPPPTSLFTHIDVNYTSTFTNLTNQPGAIYQWSFGDGTISSLENPVHTFPGTGSYLVCLTTFYCGWSDNFCMNVAVTCQPPVAAFTDSIGATLTTVYFSDVSSPAASTWDWDFGDGAVSSAQNPNHTYATTVDQIYIVCLVVTNACGVDTLCEAVNISVTGIDDRYSDGGIQLFPNPNEGQFSLQFPHELYGEVSVILYNANGMEVASENFISHSGEKRDFDFSAIAQGYYFLRIHAGDSYFSLRFIAK